MVPDFDPFGSNFDGILSQVTHIRTYVRSNIPIETSKKHHGCTGWKQIKWKKNWIIIFAPSKCSTMHLYFSSADACVDSYRIQYSSCLSSWNKKAKNAEPHRCFYQPWDACWPVHHSFSEPYQKYMLPLSCQ